MCLADRLVVTKDITIPADLGTPRVLAFIIAAAALQRITDANLQK